MAANMRRIYLFPSAAILAAILVAAAAASVPGNELAIRILSGLTAALALAVALLLTVSVIRRHRYVRLLEIPIKITSEGIILFETLQLAKARITKLYVNPSALSYVLAFAPEANGGDDSLAVIIHRNWIPDQSAFIEAIGRHCPVERAGSLAVRSIGIGRVLFSA